MKTIRYNVHFLALIAAALLYWWAIHFNVWIFGFDFFHYGLMGALHSIAIVASLRNPELRKPVAAFLLQAVSFIALVTVLGAITPILGLYLGSIIWAPITALLPPSLNNLIFIVVTGSVVGSTGYWALVRRFWMPSRGRTDLLRTVALCVAATILVDIFYEAAVPSGFSITWPEIDRHLFDLFQTTTWWFAFSISLYWSEPIPRKWNIALGTAALILVIGGTALTQREFDAYVKDDRARLSDVKRIAASLHLDWENAQDKNAEWRVPATLQDIPKVLEGVRLADPITGVPYEYRPLSGTTFQLCASFQRDSASQSLSLTEGTWSFPKGRHCFVADASKSPYSF